MPAVARTARLSVATAALRRELYQISGICMLPLPLATPVSRIVVRFSLFFMPFRLLRFATWHMVAVPLFFSGVLRAARYTDSFISVCRTLPRYHAAFRDIRRRTSRATRTIRGFGCR